MTENEFLKLYVNDRKIFGEDTKYIYEEIYSTILNERISFKSLDNLIMEDGMDNIATVLDNAIDIEDNTDIWTPAVAAVGKTMKKGKLIAGMSGINKEPTIISGNIDPSSISSVGSLKNIGIGLTDIQNKVALDTVTGKNPAFKMGFLAKLGSKAKTFFKTIKDTSLGDLMKKGTAYLTNPANTQAILGTTGGILLLALIIKALKKRNRLNKYKSLADIDKQLKNKGINESMSPEFEYAKRQLINEARYNQKVKEILLNKEKFNY